MRQFITLTTDRREQLVDITEQVTQVVERSGVQGGLHRAHGPGGAALRAFCVGLTLLLVACGGTAGGGGTASSLDVPVEGLEDVVGVEEATESGSTVRARVLQDGETLEAGRLGAALPGDIVLENTLVRFVVRAQDEGHAMAGSTSGHLVDAVRVDGGQRVDGVRELTVLVDFFQLDPDAIEITEDGASGQAAVTVSGDLVPVPLVHEALPLPKPDVYVTHTYRLGEDEPVLEIETRLVPVEGANSPSPMVGDLLLGGGDSRLWVPGHGGHDLPTTASGSVVGLASHRADSGAATYAIATEEVRQIIDASGVKVFMWESLTVPPEGVSYTRRFTVGTADVASAMAQLIGGQRVYGTVDPTWPELAVEALDAEGAPLTRCAVTAGAFDCEVPEETAGLRATWQTHGEPASETVDLSTEAMLITPNHPASVQITAADGEGEPLAFRLTGRRDGGEDRTWFAPDGVLDLNLTAGEWEVWVHHGPFFDQHHETLEWAAGADHTMEVVLARAVDTTGWASCDLHVHGEGSTDSETPVDLRLIGALADDVDYLVLTDHDYVTDPQPRLEALGLVDRLVVAAGVEISTVNMGHFNIWPLTPEPLAAGQGAPAWFGLSAPELLATLAADPGIVLQSNHPRFSSAAYFDAIGFDGPSIAEDLVSFPVMELINGIGHDDTARVFEDWMTLLDRGITVGPTGTSDVHGDAGPVGNPRTLVWVGHGPPYTADELNDAIRAGRTIATAGPLLTVELRDAEARQAGPGDRLEGSGEGVVATARIEAPAWMTLGTLQLYCGSEVVSEAPAQSGLVLEEPVPEGATWCAALHVPNGESPPGIRRPPWAVTAAVRLP